ncbi:MAG: hypothetical protein U9R70_07550 [Pseudomonadota bacterium]|nr:hypothetical protein [Pseudomonadota bacterium]
MSIASLIRDFDARKVVPVELEDVEAALAARGIKDEIYWFPADINAEVLQGQLVHWEVEADYEYPTDHTGAEVRKVAAIYYAESMDDPWRRLVGCKELLHVMDAPEARASSPEVVLKLTEKIILSPEFQDVVRDGYVTTTDRNAILQAVAVLFPWRARELFIGDGTLSNVEIAGLVDIPLRYVALVMSNSWPLIHDLLIELD